MNKPETSNLKVWPHLTIAAVICAVVAGVGVGWWVKHQQVATAEALPNAARIQRVDGDVALNNNVANTDSTNSANETWVPATANQPFSVGDRIYTRENAHASLAFTGRNFARLNPDTSLDVLSLGDRRTQLALRDGSAMFDVGYLAPGELFEVATPYGAVDLQQPGLYNVGFDNGNVLVSVLSGLAQVVGLGGTGQINKGEVLRLVGQTAADVVLTRINGGDAGYLVDDYYSYQYPRYYDGRYRDYNAYLSDPYYFDPYRRTSSYQYVNSYIPGSYDLDYYGSWQNLNGYGNAWSPTVDNSWAPYQDGYWMTDYPYGPTWVSSEPWGYAPYHYGRWVNVSNRWYWLPESVNNTPQYSPALVAFLPFAQNEIGWVPLGPGDPYSYRYYNNDWSPYYLSRVQNVQPQVVNLYVPGAVTVVPVDDFNREVDFRRARKADRQLLANVNPVLDPLTLTPLRNAVVRSAWGRGKIDLPPGIAKRLDQTTVVTSSTPVAPPFRKNIARDLRVESVNGRADGRNFRVRDERQQQPQAQEQIRGSEGGRANIERRVNEDRNQRQIENAMRQAQAERAARGQQQAQGQRVAQPAARRDEMRQRPPAAVRERGNVRTPMPVREQQAEPKRQQQPRVIEQRNRPRNMERPRPVQPPQVRQVQPQPNPQANRDGGRGQVQQQQRVERQAPNPQATRGGDRPQVQQQAPNPQANRGGGHGQAQQQQKVERKQPPSQAAPNGGGPGKGKGKKP